MEYLGRLVKERDWLLVCVNRAAGNAVEAADDTRSRNLDECLAFAEGEHQPDPDLHAPDGGWGLKP